MDMVSNDYLKQLDDLLTVNHQSWLFGAGISFNAGIPLMGPLTMRVFERAAEDTDPMPKNVLEAIKFELPEEAHIEHILSHLGDYAAIARRIKDGKVKIGTETLSVAKIDDVHNKILKWISDTIRWGYKPGISDGSPAEIGSWEQPIVKVDEHLMFVRALFNRSQAGIEQRRCAVNIFTTNYDTLLEDALALGGIAYWDGFAGGAVAFRCHRYGDKEPDGAYRARLIKLHGSIDWRFDENEQILRVREGDTYQGGASRILIYPQATKYLATQRDPFAAQFDLFRRALGRTTENILAICGYSFGDDHINDEIELALRRSDNKTTILAFVPTLNSTIERWRATPWSKRLYAITGQGLYVGEQGPFFIPTARQEKDWWKFAGVAKVLHSGAEAYAI
ncbi:hypothetical protein SPSIL_052510 [Sporomusa silvacetica DSM 10669]|uniref:SIR2-like domain-containing protein n=2 Tax=Sporomusa silvacetica TaxID=55504 RepID=A0ABZ3IU63_9FIRM|nr:hypothetical protein SPSIL_20880 [Sporomusa silvacetica DSM 10669]